MTLGVARTVTSNQSGFRAASVSERDGRRILNVDAYIPFFLTVVTNALSGSASAQYRSEFGIGIVDWRVLAMLALEPGIFASRICEVLALDKGATSKSLMRLCDKGLVQKSPQIKDLRKKNWCLTKAGEVLHDRILDRALDREERLVRGIEQADLEVFLSVLRQMDQNVSALKGTPGL